MDALSTPASRSSARGTRRPTASAWPSVSPCNLANFGLVIISGMARGVDTAAHRGALQPGGKTVAVFGTGIDVSIPRENTEARRTRSCELGGALVSEFPIGTVSRAAEFPHPQPHHQRHVARRAGGGSRRVQRHPHHRALRAGAEPRSVRRARQRDQQDFLDAEHPDQAGSEAGGHLGGRLGGTAHRCAGRPHAAGG